MKKELSYRKMYGKEEGRQKMKKDYDEIRIEDLEVFANHGVFPEENVLGQKFLVKYLQEVHLLLWMKQV